MKRTKQDSKTPEDCDHNEITPVAAFVDEYAKEAFLLKHCEQCGQNFLMMGQYPLTVC